MLGRPGIAKGLALAGASMIALTQFAVPHSGPAVFRIADDTVRLVVSSVDSGFFPVEDAATLAPADLVPAGEVSIDELFPAPAAADFNPIGLLLLPLFPLALIPLLFTLGGSIFAFLMYEFSSLPNMADAVAVEPALDDSLFNGVDLNTVFSSVTELTGGLGAGSLVSEVLAAVAPVS